MLINCIASHGGIVNLVCVPRHMHAVLSFFWFPCAFGARKQLLGEGRLGAKWILHDSEGMSEVHDQLPVTELGETQMK